MAIKKTMVDALAFVTEKGNMSQENLEIFTREFCEAKSGTTGPSTPREPIRLYLEDGTVVGRRCSTLGVWVGREAFYGDKIETESICKEADKIKMKQARDAARIIKEADSIRLEAAELDDPMEKLSKFEEYDAELVRAQEVKTAQVTLEKVLEVQPEFEYFETAEQMAEAGSIECLLEKPKKEV